MLSYDPPQTALPYRSRAYPNLRLPRRPLLRRLDRYEYPVLGFVTVLTTIIALGAASLWFRATVWSFTGVVLWLLIIYFSRESVHKQYRKYLDPKEGWFPCTALLAWAILLYLDTSRFAPLVSTTGLLTVFAPPAIMFLRRKVYLDFHTLLVLIMTGAIMAIVAFGIVISLGNSGISSLSFARPAELPKWWPNPLVILGLVWGVCGPPYLYFLIRRNHFDLLQAEAIQQAMESLHAITDPLVAAQDVADILLEKAGLGQRVIILQYDKDTDTMQVKANSGEESEKAANYKLPVGRGISRRAIRTLETQYVPDVTKDDDFDPGGLPPRGSEISAPIIIMSSGEREAIGTLNVQDNAKNAFTEEDISIVERFADIISRLQIDSSQQFIDNLRVQLETLSRIESPDSLMREIVSISERLFPGTTCCYYRLAVGTGVPISPPFFNEGRFNKPEIFSSHELMREDSDLERWLLRWQQKFLRHMSSDKSMQDGGRGFGANFQESEGAKSMCFLPIGTKQSRLGALLMFNKETRVFSNFEINRMRVFALEIWPHIAVLEHINSIRRGFANPHLHFHSTLAEAGIGRGTMEVIFDETADFLERSRNYILKNKVRQLGKGLLKFIEDIYLWEATEFFRYNRQNFSFSEKLDDRFMRLKEKYGGSIIRDTEISFEDVEGESPDTKIVLIAMIEEAVKNALHHGRARQVIVKIKRFARNIELWISDNGIGFDPSKIKLEGSQPGTVRPGSIFSLEAICQEILGADPIVWLDTAPGRGTRLVWRIPTLPKEGQVAS